MSGSVARVPMTGSVLVRVPGDLDAAAILAVANGARIELSTEVVAAVALRRGQVADALASAGAVYGVTTGMGAQSGVRLTTADQDSHQDNLLLARAVGGPPWLPGREVRAILAVRLRTFLGGDAGVSGGLVETLVSFLNRDLRPAVPRSGYGSAGEIINLAHAFGPLTGVGAVLHGDSTLDRDSTVTAAHALSVRGMVPIGLGAKEGVALLQGVPGTTAQALTLAMDVRAFLRPSATAAAMGIAAVAAPRDVYAAELTRGDDELAVANRAILGLLAGSGSTPRSLQAPVSFRVAGVVLAHLSRAVAALERAVDRALDGVTDSPAFVGGEFRSTSGFYGLDLAAALDAVAVALVHAAEVSTARIHRLLDAGASGLPAQLATRPGPDAGLVSVHKRAAGVVHLLRRTAGSSVVGTMETSFGQEDVQTFAWEAAGNARSALDGAKDVLACELLTAWHALTLSGFALGPGLKAAAAAVSGVVDPITADRPFGLDVEAVRELLGGGGFGAPGAAR